jgi:hypothetical protein
MASAEEWMNHFREEQQVSRELRHEVIGLKQKLHDLETEVERLAQALAEQTKQQAYPCSPHCAGYLREQEARAEIERLRAALQDIAEDPYAIDGGAADIARRALEGTRHQPGT